MRCTTAKAIKARTSLDEGVNKDSATWFEGSKCLANKDTVVLITNSARAVVTKES